MIAVLYKLICNILNLLPIFRLLLLYDICFCLDYCFCFCLLLFSALFYFDCLILKKLICFNLEFRMISWAHMSV